MEGAEDDLDRLAASGFIRRRSSAVVDQLKKESSGRDLVEDVDHPPKTSYRVLMLGESKVGKTSIISQFLYDQFQMKHNPTVQEMYRGQFEFGHLNLTLNIEDTSGSFAFDFPAMANISLAAADAVLIVFSLADTESFEKVALLRDLVMKTCGPDLPMVVVGNKADLDRNIKQSEIENLVKNDWENGYIECSAKLNISVVDIFKELMNQLRNQVGLSMPRLSKSINICRRQSLPIVPVFKRDFGKEKTSKKIQSQRSSALSNFKRDSCNVS